MTMRSSIAALLLGLAACAKAPADAPPTAPQGSPSVAVAPVASQTLSKPLKLPGELVALRDVILHARIQGFVDKIEIDRGSKITKGQLLVQLSAPEVAAQRSEAEARLASDLSTYQHLSEAAATPGVVSKNDLTVSAQTVEADRARVRMWTENEILLRVTAPFDGVITERWVHEGSLVTAAAPLVRLQETARLRLVVAVPEAAAGTIPAGAALRFSVPAFPGVAFSGTVARSARALDPKTRSMPVELDVDNADGRLAPGMFPEVHWQMTRQAPSLFVPASAVVTTTERIFVIRVKNGTTEWVDVRPGVSVGPLLEVFGALSEGEMVVLRGTDELRAGTAVQTKTPPPSK
jgi:RND family efflux transporter MFP subunit